jgi:hypothetical protein
MRDKRHRRIYSGGAMIGSYKPWAARDKRHRRIYSGGAMIGSYGPDTSRTL